MKKENKTDFIHALAEAYDFTDLSVSDQKVVLSEMTEAEYNEHRETVLAAMSLFSASNSYEPKPLVINKKPSILLAPVPLYQMLIGIAAMFLLMLLIFPINKIGPRKQSVEYITLRDTIETELIQYDTVERIIEKPVYREKLVYVDRNCNSVLQEEVPRLLDVPMSHKGINLVQSSIENRGFSMKDDSLAINLPRIY